jgi:hypothetical protein
MRGIAVERITKCTRRRGTRFIVKRALSADCSPHAASAGACLAAPSSVVLCRPELTRDMLETLKADATCVKDAEIGSLHSDATVGRPARYRSCDPCLNRMRGVICD